MPPIKNPRQEKFCALFFASQGTNTPAYECAIGAGYARKAARPIASRLLTFDNIQRRLQELRDKADKLLIADYNERQKVATEIVRGRLADFIDDSGQPTTDKAKLKSAAAAELTVTSGVTKDGREYVKRSIKLRDPLSGVDILNKMDNVYREEMPQYNDNRQYNFIIQSDGVKAKLNQLLSGERPKVIDA